MKLLTAVCLFSVSVAAQGSFTVLDQQPTLAGANVADLDAPQRLGDGFRSKGAGELLISFSLWGCWAGTAPAADTFEVAIHENTLLFGNSAWTVPLEPPLASFAGLAPVAVTLTGNSLMGYDGSAWGSWPEYKLEFVFPAPVLTTPGCVDHWISLASENSPGAYFNWGGGAASPNGNSNPVANYTQPNGSWSPPAVFNMQNLALVLDAVPNGISLCIENLVSHPVATNTWTASVTDATPLSIVVWAASTVGGGPVATPWGMANLSPPLILMPVIVTDALGNGSVSMSIGPGVAGAPLWFHGLDLTPFVFTNPVSIVIG